jgi:elongation factor Ts
MSIKATDVKELREKTGAGMMDCKKALVKADGDFTKAEKLLKELGLAAVSKRSGRATNEGKIFSFVKKNKGILLELSCETDFVARNKEFNDLGRSLVEKILDKNITGKTEKLEAMVTDTMTRIRENMTLRRFEVLETDGNEFLTKYIHGEGRIGVMVKMRVSESALLENSRLKEIAFDFALHIAAFAPLFLFRNKVDPAYIQDKEDIFKKQTNQLDKPEKIKEGIIKGKLNKHLSEITLMDQGFVREEKKKASQVLSELGKELGGNVDITDFLYFKVGEEIE